MRVTKSCGRSRISCGRRAVEAFAEDRSHGAGEGLHFRPERHAEVGFAFVVDLKVNAHFVRALLVFADVLEIELLVRPRLLFRRAVGVGDERFAPLHFRQMLEEVDDVLQLLGIHSAVTSQNRYIGLEPCTRNLRSDASYALFSIGAPTLLPHSVQEPS